MLFRTHIAFAFLIAVVAISLVSPENSFVFALLLMFGSALPDIDHPKSRVGRFARPFSFLFEHRGFFHSFFALALFPVLIFFLSGSVMYSSALLIGYASHIFLDSLSLRGIMPFHPLLRFRMSGFLRSGAFYEHAFFGVFAVSGILFLVFVNFH